MRREIQPYTREPRMGVGTVGKQGLVRLCFERDGERSILRHLERYPIIKLNLCAFYYPEDGVFC